MALSPGDARLSALRLDPLLVSYLLERDDQAPTEAPLLALTVTNDVGILRQHTLVWTYTPTATPRGLTADGFVVFWEPGTILDPQECAVMVPGFARRWSQFVPPGTTISYALAAFRQTHKGVRIGPKMTDPAWRLT